MRHVFSLALIAFLVASATGQSQANRHLEREACVAMLSSFAVDPTGPKPDLPEQLHGVIIEYSASGCFGSCPAFKLRIEGNKALWEGHAFVKKMGKAEKQISDREFSELMQGWFDSKLYAMRTDYCQPTCPDGTVVLITDVQETSISLKTPSYVKEVSECFTTIDGKPENPKPPEEYFQFSRRLVELAKANGWL